MNRSMLVDAAAMARRIVAAVDDPGYDLEDGGSQGRRLVLRLEGAAVGWDAAAGRSGLLPGRADGYRPIGR